MGCCAENYQPSKRRNEPPEGSLRSQLLAAAAFVAAVTLTVLAASAVIIGDLPLPLVGL